MSKLLKEALRIETEIANEIKRLEGNIDILNGQLIEMNDGDFMGRRKIKKQIANKVACINKLKFDY